MADWPGQEWPGQEEPASVSDAWPGAKRRSRREARRAPDSKSPATEGPLAASGRVHDGDTFRLTDGRNARLYGADAYELDQTGRDPIGNLMQIGRQARDAFGTFAQPSAMIDATGGKTYGRPVVTVENNGRDAAANLLHDGLAVTTPRYLRNDPERLGSYMQEERLARMNRRGAFAGSAQAPEDFRREPVDPAPGEYGNAQAVFFDDPTPFQGLPPEQERGLMSIWTDFTKGPQDYVAYAKANGIEVDPKIAAEQFRKRDRDQKAGGNGIPAMARPRVLTDLKDGRTGATLRGFADPINMLDEAGAVVDTLLPGGERENVWGSDRRFGDILANNLEQNRSILDHDEKDYEWWRFGGQLASGVALPGASVEGVGLAAARSALRGGASRFAAEQAARRAFVSRLGAAGAVEGGLAGVGQGETAGERVVGGLIGAPAGGALAVGAGFAAPRVAQLVGRPFSNLTGRAGERTAEDFADGAVDTAKAIGNNDALEVRVPDLPGTPPSRPRDPADAAMASEVEQPTLYGPSFADDAEWPGRPVDRIDLAQPRDMLSPTTDSERRAVADRLASSDVLPLPSNAVDGIDEAAKIERGRFAPVRAPNEADVLTTGRYPNTNTGTPIAKKGPLDLVTWLRTQGGIKAQGGELAHAGIDNAPRNDLDFAGGEQRLGPLVSDRGLTYDEAAERAWEMGYFPEGSERPTVREFLDALTETHRGHRRAFLRDDLAEVEAFEQTRQQRWDVEKAIDRNGPLTSDRAQPVEMADLDANAPPVQAYEEWGENAPDFAGNIRLSKLDSPQAIKRALVQTERATGGFDAARRGRITQAETVSLAADLGMTPDNLLARRKGAAFNAEAALAARQILARSATDLVNMAKRIARVENPGDEAEASFREAWLRHAAIQEQVAGMTAEAGRALQQFRQNADAKAVGRVLPSLGDIPGGSARLKEVADQIVDLEAAGVAPGGINRFTVRALRARKRDMAMEYYINALLSGPQTHATNMLSNTLTALAQIPEHAIAAGVGGVRRAGEKVAARALRRDVGNPDRVMLSEVGARTAGLLQGTKDGLREALRTFRTGDAPDAVTKVENAGFKAIPGPAGELVRIPTRLLSAEDELFKGMARRMELSGLAVRKARAEGLKGEAAKRRATELLDNPTDEMLDKAQDYARYLTFQAPLGPVTSKIAGATNSSPFLKFLIPFVRTPTNLLKFAMERSPAAPMLKEWRNDIAAGGARRDLAAARALVGTGIGAIFYEAALDGRITGGGPADDNARRLLQADGWQPYSVRVGDRYYSYRRLDPFSTTIGTVADMVDLGSHMTERQQEKSLTLVTAAILNNLASKTWLTGVSGLAEALADPDRNWQNFVARSAGAIAVPAFVAQVARTTDPIIREARDPMSRIRSRVPGMSDDLYPKRDVMGRPVRSEGGLGPDIVSPVWTGTRTNDPTLNALIDAGMRITPPSRSYSAEGKRVDWAPAQYDQLQEAVGARAKPGLDSLIRAGNWRSMSSDDRQDEVSDLMKIARAGAKAEVLRAAPR